MSSASERLRRAVKENNIYLVRRLVSRADVDIRNPDVDSGELGDGYTSLAWAALYGHADIFEYLLNCGHDDLELSKDEDMNTILILLASLRKGAWNHYCGCLTMNDVHDSALRMARAYHERYPNLLDFANELGKTALHVAATEGNEDFVRLFCDLGADKDLPDVLGNTPLHYASTWGHSPVAKVLINAGCSYTARNNRGFAAADFAFSEAFKDDLESAIRERIENNKKLRRAASAAARDDWGRLSIGDDSFADLDPEAYGMVGGRVRSLSNASGRTTTSEETDYGGPVQAPALKTLRSQASQSSMIGSSSYLSETSPTSTLGPPSLTPTTNHASFQASTSPSTSSVTSSADRHAAQPVEATRPSVSPVPTTRSGPSKIPAGTSISPVAHRMLERDQGAMAQYQQYINRKRTGSENSRNDTPIVAPGPQSSSRIGRPRLRPSASAAVLSAGTSSSPATSILPIDPKATPRVRADTFDLHATPRYKPDMLESTPLVNPRPLPSHPNLPAVAAGGDTATRRIISPVLAPKPPPRNKEITPWEYPSDDDSSPPAVQRTGSS